MEYLMPRAAFYPGSGETKLPSIPVISDDDSTNKLDENIVQTSESSLEKIDESGLITAHQNLDNEDEDEDEDNHSYVIEESSNSEEVEPHLSESIHLLEKVYDSHPHEPLILDVGVELPDTNITTSEYRHQWRNYFRYVAMKSEVICCVNIID